MYLRMQATNRSAVSFPSRNGLIGCVVAIVLALSALAFASTASAAPPKPNYLALGDSLAFGYSAQLFNQNFPAEPPTAFENGYVNDYFATITGSPKTLINYGCPGETTDSMIGTGPLGKAMEAKLGGTHTEACGYHNLGGYPLHNEYGGMKSQLEAALETIAAGAAPGGTPVETVTLDIGPNDEVHQLDQCSNPFPPQVNCFLPVLPHILKNLVDILDVIRFGSTWGGVNYTGKLVVLGVYNPYGALFKPNHELVPMSNKAQALLNSEEKKRVTEPEPGACYANSLPYFNPQNHTEPKRLQTLTEMANPNGPTNTLQRDIHASPLGYQELANIIAEECP